MQNLFNPTKSIYRALEDAKQATQCSSNGLQQPQTVVFAPYLYENYYIGKVCNPAIVVLHPTMELASDRRTTDLFSGEGLLCIAILPTISAS